MRGFVGGSVLAFVVGVTTTPALADHAEYRDVAVGSGLRFPASVEASSPVDTQHVTLTCRDDRGGPVCDFRASYKVAARASDQRDALAGAFYGRHVRDLQLVADGSKATGALRSADAASLEERVLELLCNNLLSIVFAATPAAECTSRAAERLARWTHGELAMDLSPGDTKAVIVTGTLEPGVSHTSDESWMPSRHPLLGQLSVRTYYVDFWLDSAHAETEFEVRVPEGWTVWVRSPTRTEEGRQLEAEAWPFVREGGMHVARRRFSPENLPDAVNVTIERSPSVLRRGGPFVGVGAALNADADFRMRMGYELALGKDPPARATLASLAVDTDWRELAIITPALELALPVFVPSLGLGVGLPVVLAPERRVGVRGLFGVHVWGLGFVATYDWLPGTSMTDRARSRWTLLGQVSF